MTLPNFAFRAISSSAPADSEERRKDYSERPKAAIAQRKPPEGQDEQTETPSIIPED
jgi:hypothetical protein